VPSRPATSRQLGLSRDAEALAARAEGLIVVAAAHINGAHALVAALVDVINRTRRVHVICIEREVSAIHESEAALISQREAGRSLARAVDCARAALRENPDVLVIDTVLNADLLELALDAAHHGHLVICAARGDSVARALSELVGMSSPAQRPRTQMALARTLAGVLAETAPLSSGAGADDTAGGSRAVLVNSPETAYLIAEGRFAGLGHPDRRRQSL
jgi:twitching motility protein PilT